MSESELGPVVIRPGGEVQRVTLREAILHKSYEAGTISDRRLVTSLESEAAVADYNQNHNQERHRVEMWRRSNKVIRRVKEQLIERIGSCNRFNTNHPAFREICAEHGYSPYSLIGSLVKYHFVVKVGKEKEGNPTAHGKKAMWMYMIMPPDNNGNRQH